MASDIFFVKALIAGVGLGLFVSVLGCFVVWQRMSYFGESLAHSSFRNFFSFFPFLSFS